MCWLLVPPEKDRIGLKRLGALLRLVTVEYNYEEAGDSIRAVFQIGLMEVNVSLMLDVVVTLPPVRILAARPCIPRLEDEVIPSDQNLLAGNLAVNGNARPVIVDVGSLSCTVDLLASDLAQDIDFGTYRQQQFCVFD